MNHLTFKKYLTLLLVVTSSFAFGQHFNNDSLYNVWSNKKNNDLERVKAYFTFFNQKTQPNNEIIKKFIISENLNAEDALSIAQKYHKTDYLGILYVIAASYQEINGNLNKACDYANLGITKLLEQKDDFHTLIYIRGRDCPQFDSQRIETILNLINSRLEEPNIPIFNLVSGYFQHYNLNHPEKACEYYSKAIEAALKQKQFDMLFLGLWVIKNTKCNQYSLTDIDRMLQLIIKDKESQNLDYKDYIDFYSKLSQFYAASDQYPNAMRAAQKVLWYAETYKDYQGDYIEVLQRLGRMHNDIGNYNEAEKYQLKALKRAKELDDLNYIGGSYINLTNIYINKKEKNNAQKFLDSAIYIMRDKKECENCYMSARRVRARLNNLLGNYKDALDELNDIQKFIERKENHFETTQLYGTLSTTYLGLKQYDKAIANAQKGIQLNENNLSDNSNLFEVLYQASEKQGDYKNALKNYKQYVKIQDSMSVLRNGEETTRLELERKFSQQRLTDSLKVAKQKLQTQLTFQNQLNKQKFVKNLLIVLGCCLLLFAIGLYYRLKFIKKTEIELKKKNEIIEAEKQKAQASEKAKHQFLANMSHEIRTPMNAIKGMTDILIRRKPRKDQMTYLNAIKQSSDSLLIIIDDILDISKIEAGKIELKNQPFSIYELVNNIHTTMQFKAEEKGLQLKNNLPPKDIIVLGDATKLKQIIINLVGNAIKFTENGIVTITVTSEHVEDKLKLHVTVSDTGIGIDQNLKEKIFKSFEQAYTDTSRKYGGTGLGLSISKKLIELQNGKIWVESKKGQGSQFHFTIPYKLVTDTDKEQGKTIAKSDKIMTSSQLKNTKILLVEDNQFNAMVAKDELEDAIENVFVELAENGLIALEKLKTQKFDIVLMDVQMPIMNGYQATKNIRALTNDDAKLPIIAMTANVLKDEIDRCYEAGMNDFVGKPFNTTELLNKIAKLIKN
ncbi:MAG: ATP-binding protein [Gelidibacter sp.]